MENKSIEVFGWIADWINEEAERLGITVEELVEAMTVIYSENDGAKRITGEA